MVVLLRPTACSTPASQFSMVASLRSHRPRLWHGGVPALRTPFGRVLAPPALRASAVRKAHLRCFLLHWAHRRLLHPRFAMVVLLRPTACSTPASQFSMVAPHRSQAHSRCSLLHWAHRRLLHPQFAMVVLLRPTACSIPLLIGLTTACFAHCARPSCAPLAAPPLSPSLGSSYRPALRWPGIPGLRMPFGRVLAPPPLRGFDGYGLFRALRAAFVRPTGCAVSFALIGVFVPACASLARYSGAADALWACPRPSTPSGLRRLRPVSRTARGEAPSHSACSSCAPLVNPSVAATPRHRSTIRNGRPATPSGLQYSLAHWAYYGLFPPQAAAFVRPFAQGRLWGSAAYCDSATNQKAPLDSKGSCRR